MRRTPFFRRSFTHQNDYTKTSEGSSVIDIDTFIERRHKERVKEEGHRPSEEMWAESVRRYNAKLRQENRAAWCEYHRAAAERARATLERLIADHEAQAQKLLNSEANERKT